MPKAKYKGKIKMTPAKPKDVVKPVEPVSQPDPNEVVFVNQPYLVGTLLGRPCASFMSTRGPVFYFQNREVVLNGTH